MDTETEIKNLTFEELEEKYNKWYDKIITDQKYYSDDDEIIRYTSSPYIVGYLLKIYEKLLAFNLIIPFIILQSIVLLTYNRNIRFLNIKPIYEFFYNNILIFLKIDNKVTNISDIISVIVHNKYSRIKYQLLDLFLNMSKHFYSYDLNDIDKIYYIDYNNELKIDKICKTKTEFENCTSFYKIVMVNKYEKFNTQFFSEVFITYFGITSLEINTCLTFALRTYNASDIECVKLLLSNNKKLNILYFIDIFTNTDDFTIEILDIMLKNKELNTIYELSCYEETMNFIARLELILKISNLYKLLNKVKINNDSITIEYENVSEIEKNALDAIIYNYKNFDHYICFNSKLIQLKHFLSEFN